MENGTVFLILATIAAFFMAFTNGANDVANSFASTVGSKALTIRRALILSSIVTFLGATLLGGNVAARLIDGIVEPSLFPDAQKYTLAMLTILLASGIFILLSTLTGIPVSSTHSIVGSLTGVSIVVGGWGAVNWGVFIGIALSWILSPILAGFLAFFLITLIKRFIIKPGETGEVRSMLHRLSLIVAFGICAIIWTLLTQTKLKIHLGTGAKEGIWIALALFLPIYITARILLNKSMIGKSVEEHGIEGMFRNLQIGTSCYVAFGNGANDVANSISPMYAIFVVVGAGRIPEDLTDGTLPTWILTIGGIGIMTGILLLGKNVIRTLGEKITTINHSQGFSIDFSVATTVIAASALGIPISTTHAATGAIVGTGLSCSKKGVQLGILARIFIAWIVTVPCAAIITLILYKILEWILF